MKRTLLQEPNPAPLPLSITNSGFLYSQLLRAHDALVAVLLPRGIPDGIVLSRAGKLPILEQIPELPALILQQHQKCGFIQIC